MAIIQQIENGKLVDSSASNTSLSTENKSDAAGGALDKDAFLQLLVAQMQYQDPLEPTDNTEYISQLATFSQLEEMQNLNQSLTEGSAYNLVGKYVFVKVTNNQTGETSYDHGMVEYVMRENGKVYISVNDSLYNIDDLDTVSDPDYYTATTVAKSFTNMVKALPSEKNLTIYDEEKKMKENSLLFGGFFALREDDLIHKEEDDHGDAAVEHGGADVVDEVGHQQTGHRDPDAVDGVDDAGDDAEGQHIPCDLLAEVALAAEDEAALDGEVNALADDHSDHVSAEVGQTAVSGVIAEDVPLEGLAEQGDVDARPAEVHHRQTLERCGQELQQQILEDGDEVRHDDEQTTLTHPFGSRRVLGGKIIPEVHTYFPFSCFSGGFPSAR